MGGKKGKERGNGRIVVAEYRESDDGSCEYVFHPKVCKSLVNFVYPGLICIILVAQMGLFIRVGNPTPRHV